jgi:hypothetical protein
MYVIRIKNESFRYNVSVIEKIWSEEMLSNKVEVLDNRKFFLKFRGRKWAEKRILKMMKDIGKLEITNG